MSRGTNIPKRGIGNVNMLDLSFLHIIIYFTCKAHLWFLFGFLSIGQSCPTHQIHEASSTNIWIEMAHVSNTSYIQLFLYFLSFSNYGFLCTITYSTFTIEDCLIIKMRKYLKEFQLMLYLFNNQQLQY